MSRLCDLIAWERGEIVRTQQLESVRRGFRMHQRLAWLVLICALQSVGLAAEPLTINVWPAQPPGETGPVPPEERRDDPNDRPVGGRGTVRIANVSTPTLTIYRPAPDRDTGAAAIICPGGGFVSLAWAHEGTDVAEWLNSIGVTGIVLKYRIPPRDPGKRWLSAVQDIQRAISLVRSKADEWKLDPKRIALIGFSAGGQAAGLVSINPDRMYPAVDDVDRISSRPDFAMLFYSAGFVDDSSGRLRDEIKVTAQTPPMFFVHAFDDRVSALNSLLLAAELKKVEVPAEVHVFATGGHGFGLRHVDGKPATDWPAAGAAWLRSRGVIK